MVYRTYHRKLDNWSKEYLKFTARARADNPLGTKFWWQQKGLFPFAHMLQVSNWDFISRQRRTHFSFSEGKNSAAIYTAFDLYQSLNRLPILNSQNCSMFPLAFVAGWLQDHWWGFVGWNYVVWPTFLLMNVFIALKGSHFWFLFPKLF